MYSIQTQHKNLTLVLGRIIKSHILRSLWNSKEIHSLLYISCLYWRLLHTLFWLFNQTNSHLHLFVESQIKSWWFRSSFFSLTDMHVPALLARIQHHPGLWIPQCLPNYIPIVPLTSVSIHVLDQETLLDKKNSNHVKSLPCLSLATMLPSIRNFTLVIGLVYTRTLRSGSKILLGGSSRNRQSNFEPIPGSLKTLSLAGKVQII